MNRDAWRITRRVSARPWPALALALTLGGLLVGLLFAILPAGGAAAAPPAAPAVAYPCSQAGLNAALAAGGSATFNCAVTTTVVITPNGPKLVNKNVSLDGGNKLILSGGGLTGVFTVAAGIHLDLLNLTVRDAQAPIGAGVYNNGYLAITHSQFISNRAGLGGAIFNQAQLTVTFSAFTDNVATEDGGAIYNDHFAPATVTSSDFTHNTAQNDSGGAVANLGVFTVTESLFTRNYGAPHLGYLTGGGGAIYSYDGPLFARLTPSRLNGPGGASSAQVPQGGPPTRLFVDHSRFILNSSEYEGGAIDGGVALIQRSTFLSNTASFGGAIDVLNEDFVVSSSTFIANAVISTSLYLHPEGGAIDVNGRAMRVFNSTFYANHVPAGGVGGAIQADGAVMTVTNSSFVSNTAAENGAGGAFTSNSNVIARNVLIAYNAGGNCDSSMVMDAHNIDFPGSTCSGSALSLDPLALAPADNGGPTLTSALLPNSPAIDAGNDPTCLASDQRGGHRPVGAHCDIGAFEFGVLFPRLWLPLVRK